MPSPLTEIAEAPKFITPDEHQEAQQSTPGSFAAIPPVLRFKLDPVSIYIRPTPSNPPQCFASFQVQQQDQDDEGRVTTSASQGSLWLTEESLSFLSSETSSGFKLSYPAISLHAVTRSPPQGLYGPSTSSSTNASTSSSTGCLYCQLDLSSGEQDAEEEQDEDTLVEMHIFTQDDETLEQLFESLSYCASLHPSAGGDDGGNPFSGLAPFGNGLPNGSSGMALDGEYDDADEGDDDLVTDVQAQDGDQEELSEAGRVRNDFQTPDSRYRPY
ncbi:hypothetical protein IE53DRAFT_338979 [Violaceomyces palustris]|uniref:Uncharacterized protein n=1 Tax=Violaceomyces palustris TaxID=1673888 RepID=A0ACD0P5T0_9BASI|nr:hypothetical protein IE53DRAFT_338979 [Violaceomyces palustris]